MPDITGELPAPRLPASPADPPTHRFRRDQYLQMVEAGVLGPSDKVELLEGRVVEMSPQNVAHVRALRRLSRLVERAVGDRADVYAQMPLPVGADSVPEPDLYITRPNADAHGLPDHALLVVEVADTSLATDRDVKGPLYAAAGIPEYWIVDVVHQVFEVYRDPRHGRYASLVTLSAGDSVQAIAVEGLAVEVNAVVG